MVGNSQYFLTINLICILLENKKKSKNGVILYSELGNTKSAYDYSIQYRLGRDLIGADALSKLPVSPSPERMSDPGDYALLLNVVNQSPVTASKIRYWTNRDLELAKVYSYVERGWPCELNKDVNLSSYCNRKQELTTLQGCLIWES